MPAEITKALQVNLHHAKSASGTLVQRFTKQNIGIALIQEPWIRAGRICGLTTKTGKLVYDRSATRPRAAILINQTLDWFPLTQFTSSDLVAVSLMVKTKNGTHEIICASAYFPGEEIEAPPEAVQELVKHCRRRNVPYIIGCDANAHHSVWGSSDDNNRGESLLNYLFTEQVQIVNKGNRPTFVSAGREEVLDLTLCSTGMMDYIGQWHVSDEPSLSDHMHIRFDITNGLKTSRERRDKKRTDWKRFDELLSERVKDFSTPINSIEDIEQGANQLTATIKDTFEECSQILKEPRSKDQPWWNDDLERQKSKVHTAWNKVRTPENRMVYNQLRNELTDMIRTAKEKDWRKFCGELESIPETARLHKLLAKDGTNGVGTLIKTDGKHTQNRAETLEVLLKTHFPGCSKKGKASMERAPPFGDRKRAKAVSGRIFSPERVEWAIKTFKPFKAAGEDGIFPALLQRGLKHLKQIIIDLFRASFIWGYIPTSWRKVNVIFLAKANKPSDQAKAYRPVSLTSFLLKTMEKLIDVHLRSIIEGTSPLSDAQYAYRRGRSTELALHVIVTEIEKTIQHKDFALGAFLDIEGAFDNTGYDAIMRALTRKNTDTATKSWIHAMLAGRIVKSTLGMDTMTIQSKRGCPQGGVLSPLLWSLVVDELLVELEEAGFTIIGYADDIAIYVTGKFEATVRERMAEAIEITMKWCKRVGLSANPQKTTIVPFTYRRKFDSSPIVVEEESITISKEVKYLGVILDQKLNWNKHIQHVKQKAARALWTSSRYCGRTWGISPELMLAMYQMTVRPIITYAAWIWWPKVDQKGTINKLTTLQRYACLSITGAMCTTPTAAMEAILGLIPIHIHIKEMAARCALKQTCMKGSMGTSGHMSILKAIPNSDYLMQTSDIRLGHRDFDKPFETIILKGDRWSLENLGLESNTSIWYTDGSRTAQGTGCGVFGPNTKISASLGKTATIFQAELEAVRMCVQHLQDRRPKGQRFAILSDSQAVIKALTHVESNSNLVRECLVAIKELTHHNKLQLCWVPGHTGVDGNEEADELARKGAGTKYIGPEPVCGLNWSANNAAIGEWSRNQALKHWRNLTGHRQSKSLINPYSSKEAKLLSRSDLRRLVGYLTGHHTVYYHLSKMGRREETTCRLCMMDPETTTHILCGCTSLDKIRHEILGKTRVTPEDIKVSDIKALNRLAKKSDRYLAV